MNRFVIKVDLSAFYDNSYEKVMILVDMEWPNVSKVEKRLEEMFNVHDIALKSDEGFLIPSEESVEILKYVEVLIAFPKVNITKKRKLTTEKSENKSKSKDISLPSSILPKMKRKHLALNETNFTTSTPGPNLAKRIRSNSATSSTLESAGVSQISNVVNDVSALTNSNTHAGNRNKSKATSKNSSNKFRNTSNGEPTNLFKKPNGSVCEVSSKTNVHIHYDESGTEENENDNPESEKKETAPKKEILFACDLENLAQKSRRIFHIGQKPQNTNNKNRINGEMSLKSKPETIEVIENIRIANGNVMPDVEEKTQNHSQSINEEKTVNSMTGESDSFESQQPGEFTESLISCDDESAVIELNESENVSTTNELSAKTDKSSAVNIELNESENLSISNEVNKSSSNERENVSIAIELSADIDMETSANNETESAVDKILSTAIALKNLPNVNDVVVFKLFLSNDKLSDYFIGKCEYVNKRSKTMKFYLTDGLSQIKYMPQKFACNFDDSIEFRSINVKLQDLFDAKVSKI